MKNLKKRLFGGELPDRVRSRDIRRLYKASRPDVSARHQSGRLTHAEVKPRLEILVPGQGFIDAEKYNPVLSK